MREIKAIVLMTAAISVRSDSPPTGFLIIWQA
jgi:hypothetical protein